MRGELGVGEVSVKREKLSRSQHPFIDDDLGGQAAGIDLFGFTECLVAAQRVGEPLSDQVQNPLEGVAAQIFGSSNKKLGDIRLSEQRCGAHIRSLGVGRHVTPADQSLSFFKNDLINGFYTLLSFDLVLWQKDVADGIAAGFR